MMDGKTSLYASWGVALVMGVALMLQMGQRVKPEKTDQPVVKMQLVAENEGVVSTAKVWRFPNPDTGEMVYVTLGKVTVVKGGD